MKCRHGTSVTEHWRRLDESSPKDIWFGVDCIPSAYVILEISDDTLITDDVIFQCATLCKKISKEKHLDFSRIMYCTIKNIKKGKTIGSVQFIKPAFNIMVYQ
jgi:predicted ribosome quality control (RQC) complex YloA/Tae2 family protein